MPQGTVWSPEEDQRLAELVQLHGPKKWCQIASDLNTNKGSKQCRRRWKNFLSLDERKLGSWTAEEDAQLLECHRLHGNKWTLIAQEIGGRTDNAVKNRYAALEKKKRTVTEKVEVHQQRGAYSRGTTCSLLGIRRIISKDQPQRSFTSRSYTGLQDVNWMQDALGSSSDRPAGETCPGQAANGSRTADVGLAANKPELQINIPGATAPELPYSQISQVAAAEAGRLHNGDVLTPGALWFNSGLNALDQGKGEEDALLSTSRQGAQAVMAGLATPTEEPSTISEVYKFLYGATPAAQQLAAAGVGAAAAAQASWREPVVPPMVTSQHMVPASSEPYVGHRQAQHQHPSMLQHQAEPAAEPGLSFAEQPRLGRTVSGGAVMTYAPQTQMQLPGQNLSKLGRTVSSFEAAGPNPMPSLTGTATMMRQQVPQQPQAHFVPQGHHVPGEPAPGSFSYHSNAAVTTAAGGLHSSARSQDVPHSQQLLAHRPVVTQAQLPTPHYMPQEPMLPSHQALTQPAAAHVAAPAPASQPQPSQHWGAEELRQLLDLLGEAAVNEGQPGSVSQQLQQPLCHDQHPDAKLEHANNITGSLSAAM